MWSAEGLLSYLPAAGQDLLFERIVELSAPGSRVAVEAFSPRFFDPEYLERQAEQWRRIRESGAQTPNDLWYVEERTDLEQWLTGRGWKVAAIEALDLMRRYGRSPAADDEQTIPRSVFIEGRRPS